MHWLATKVGEVFTLNLRFLFWGMSSQGGVHRTSEYYILTSGSSTLFGTLLDGLVFVIRNPQDFWGDFEGVCVFVIIYP